MISPAVEWLEAQPIEGLSRSVYRAGFFSIKEDHEHQVGWQNCLCTGAKIIEEVG
jgi:hypothetical protein